jgi:hypothetical protein
MAIDQAALNALSAQWGATRAQLDDDENRLRINYNNVLDKMKRDYKTGAGTLHENMSDRGLLQSGPSIGKDIELKENANRAGAQASEKQNLDLATIARRRLEAEEQYNSQRLLLNLQLAGETGA